MCQAAEASLSEAFTDPGSPIRVRVGIHTGEVVADSDDFFGNAVNYAARVASAAHGGEILVSPLFHDLIEPTGAFAFDAPRLAQLKGLSEPVPLYPLVAPGTQR